MELAAIQHLDTYNLYVDAKAIEEKVDNQDACPADFELLVALSNQFSAIEQDRECLFCQKVQVKFLRQQYHKSCSIVEGISILESAHDLAIDIITRAEATKKIAPSFYKALLEVKIDLAKANRSLGFYDEAVALEACARRICNKAQNLFPTYQNFPSQLLNQQ